jgi:hypothetical protein
MAKFANSRLEKIREFRPRIFRKDSYRAYLRGRPTGNLKSGACSSRASRTRSRGTGTPRRFSTALCSATSSSEGLPGYCSACSATIASTHLRNAAADTFLAFCCPCFFCGLWRFERCFLGGGPHICRASARSNSLTATASRLYASACCWRQRSSACFNLSMLRCSSGVSSSHRMRLMRRSRRSGRDSDFPFAALGFALAFRRRPWAAVVVSLSGPDILEASEGLERWA